MIRALTAAVALVMVVGGTFVYGAIKAVTDETWPDCGD